MGFPEEKREMLNTVTSNRRVDGKNLELKPSIAFLEIVNRSKNEGCDPERTTPRTLDRIFDNLIALNNQGLLPDLESVAGFQKKDTVPEISVKE